MNYSRVILSTILIVVAASAQTPIKSPPAPGLTVTQISWRKEAYVPALYDDPLARNQEHTDLEREQKATIRQNVIRAQSGQLPLPIPTRPASSTRPGLSAVYYRYEAKVSNTSQKTIREIVWEYSLSEPETEVQIGSHQYTSKVSLRRGKIATLIGLSNTPPNGVVLVDKGSDKLQNKYVERVVIRRIEFGDGTIWERPVN